MIYKKKNLKEFKINKNIRNNNLEFFKYRREET
jgi:hypothetical protein